MHTTKFNVYIWFCPKKALSTFYIMCIYLVCFFLFEKRLCDPHICWSLFCTLYRPFLCIYNVQTCSNKWQNKRFTICSCAILTAWFIHRMSHPFFFNIHTYRRLCFFCCCYCCFEYHNDNKKNYGCSYWWMLYNPCIFVFISFFCFLEERMKLKWILNAEN